MAAGRVGTMIGRALGPVVRWRPVRAVWTWPLRCVDAVRMFRAATRFQLGQPEDLQRQLGRVG